jgi:hypothetical protein
VAAGVRLSSDPGPVGSPGDSRLAALIAILGLAGLLVLAAVLPTRIVPSQAHILLARSRIDLLAAALGILLGLCVALLLGSS